MDGTQRFVLGDQVMRGAQFRRQWILHRIKDVEHLTHAGEDVPALHFGAGRIDRKESALEVLYRKLAPGGLRGLGDVFQAVGAAGPAVRRVEDEKRRVRQLHGVLVEPDLPGQHHPRALGEVLADVARVEERGGHCAAPGADGDAEDLLLRVSPRRDRRRRSNGVDDGDVLTRFRLLIFGTAHRRTLGVAAGIVAQQVVDRPHAEHLVELIGGVGAQDVVQPIGE